MRNRYLLLACAVFAAGVRLHALDCNALAKAKLADATVISAEMVGAGPLHDSAAHAARQEPLLLPAFCRVRGNADPSIGFEIWMPEQNWNGRLLALGNGGFGGTIDPRPMAQYLLEGYAVTANDTGHTGMGTEWMHNPSALLAWGHDATHRALKPAEVLVRAYYGRPQRFAYFQGCSTGGAQAMEEAEFYPRDFNGIVAESPGMDYSHLMLSFLWGLKSARDHAALSEAKLELLHKAVLERCDADDGLADGLLGRPLACHIHLEDLLCKDGQSNNCLTSQETATARLIYQGPRNRRTGAPIYPGFAPGSEAGDASVHVPGGGSFMLNGWTLIQGRLAEQYAIPLLKNMVFGKEWDWTTFDWDKDVRRVDEVLGSRIDSMDPDLRPFQEAGGKLVMVQGWDDPLNAANLPIEYRTQVIEHLSRSTSDKAAEKTVDGFFRLFMAPGMSHCEGGDGPSKMDALGAMTDWVEKSKPPSQMIATKVQMPSGTPTEPVVQRPLCPYPEYARFVSGDPNRAQSFRCSRPSTATKGR